MLIIDDDPDLIAVLEVGLEQLGQYMVATARDGASGLNRFSEFQPDCVVVDIRMPSLDGYQVVRALRGDPQTAEIPIVVLSARVQDRDALAGMLSGADAYLRKPATTADLVQAIAHAIELTAEQREQRVQWLASGTSETPEASG